MSAGLGSTFCLDDYRQRIAEDGFAIVPDVLSGEYAANLRQAIAQLPESEEVRRKTNVYGVRNLLELCPAVRELASASVARNLVAPILGPECFAVRATFFDKVPGANWNLQLHQDSVISVKQRLESDGFHAWSQKAGVVQVRPPVSVLTGMLAVRLHLDDCFAANGALRILAGSHHRRWKPEEIPVQRENFRAVICEVPERGALIMRPLVLHASGAAESPSHRRVIHIEYAAQDLPNGLEWKNRV